MFKSYGNFAEKSELFLLDKVAKLVGGGSVINGAYPSSLYKCDPFKIMTTNLKQPPGQSSDKILTAVLNHLIKGV